MDEVNKKQSIKNKDDNNIFEFSVKFNKNGDSFQKIMENIIISKLQKDTKNI